MSESKKYIIINLQSYNSVATLNIILLTLIVWSMDEVNNLGPCSGRLKTAMLLMGCPGCAGMENANCMWWLDLLARIISNETIN